MGMLYDDSDSVELPPTIVDRRYNSYIASENVGRADSGTITEIWAESYTDTGAGATKTHTIQEDGQLTNINWLMSGNYADIYINDKHVARVSDSGLERTGNIPIPNWLVREGDIVTTIRANVANTLIINLIGIKT